jgi:tetratricopeptide (TPR) repeat protein
MKLLTPILLALFLSGCFAHAVNKRNADRYYSHAVQSEMDGDWFEARKGFARAWTNVMLAHGEDEAIAAVAYEYGRTSGAICDWEEAERGLMESYKIHKNTHSPTLVELARMYHVRGDLNKSEEFFLLAKELLERNHADYIAKDPVPYVNFLNEYAEVLGSLGKIKESEQIMKRVEEVQNKYKRTSTNHEPPTPYGKFCHQNPRHKPKG